MYRKLASSTFLKNFSWLALGQIFYRVAYFVTIALLARIVPLNDYGLASYFLLYVGLWAPLFNFGLGIVGVREIAQGNISAEDFISKVISLKILVVVLAGVLLMVSGIFFEYSGDQLILLFCFSVYAILISLAEFFHIPFIGIEKMHITARLIIVERAVISILAILLLIVFSDIWGFAFGYILGGIISVIISYKVFRRAFSFSLRIDNSILKFFIRESWPVALNMFFSLSYNRIGVVFLENMKSRDVVAYYNSAFFVLFALQMGVSTLMQAIFPKLSRAQKNKNSIGKSAFKVFKIIFPILFLSTLILFYFSDSLILVFYGEELKSSIPILRVLIWVFPLFTISTFWANYFRAGGNQRLMAVISGSGMLFNIAGSVLLINAAGAVGLAKAYVISEFLIVIMCFLLFISHQRDREITFSVIAYLAIMFLIIGGSLFYSYIGLSLTVFCLITIGILVVISLIGIKNADVKFIKNLIV
ncbi:flippase [Ekhidna sp.]|uniref:flippase n=1 Tax=Ekhidna sp. TaxID=2608089 RepID=UPI003CCC0AED